MEQQQNEEMKDYKKQLVTEAIQRDQ